MTSFIPSTDRYLLGHHNAQTVCSVQCQLGIVGYKEYTEYFLNEKTKAATSL